MIPRKVEFSDNPNKFVHFWGIRQIYRSLKDQQVVFFRTLRSNVLERVVQFNRIRLRNGVVCLPYTPELSSKRLTVWTKSIDLLIIWSSYGFHNRSRFSFVDYQLTTTVVKINVGWVDHGIRILDQSKNWLKSIFKLQRSSKIRLADQLKKL